MCKRIFCLLYPYLPIVCLLLARRFQNFICYSYCLVTSIFLFVFFLFLQRDICAIKLKLKTILKTGNGSQKKDTIGVLTFFWTSFSFFLLFPLFLSFFTCFIRITWKIWLSQWNSKYLCWKVTQKCLIAVRRNNFSVFVNNQSFICNRNKTINIKQMSHHNDTKKNINNNSYSSFSNCDIRRTYI